MAHAHPSALLIEDHEELREGLGLILRSERYAVETARDGREALRKLYAGLRPCIIITDLMMPAMTGFEFRQEQLAQPEFADIPFIIYSGITDAVENAAQLNATAYLEKPVEIPRLVRLVKTHCLK